MEAKSAITVTSDLPPEQQDPDLPFQAVIGDMTGYREPPAEDEDDSLVAEREAQRFAARDVSPTNFDESIGVWRPRVNITVPDVLTDDPDQSIAIDVEFERRSKFWPGELDRKVPEIVKLDEMIRQLERLQSTLNRKVAVRSRLQEFLLNLVAEPENTIDRE
jgi:type VI secretion system ImpB/VipA family protein